MPPASHGPLGWIAMRGLELKRKQAMLIKSEDACSSPFEESRINDAFQSPQEGKAHIENAVSAAAASHTGCIHHATAAVVHYPISSHYHIVENENSQKQLSETKTISAGSCESSIRSNTVKGNPSKARDVKKVDCKLLPAIGMHFNDYRRVREAERNAQSTGFDVPLDLFSHWPDGEDETRDDRCHSSPKAHRCHTEAEEPRITRISLLPPLEIRWKLTTQSDECAGPTHTHTHIHQ
jgi:hypothetical protein